MPSSEPDILTATVQDGPAGSSVVVAAGEIDRDSRRHLRRAADEALGNGRHRLVLDLSAVSYCDSSGLSLFVDLHREAKAAGGWLRLVGAQPLLQHMLGATNLDRILALYDSVEAATGNETC